jgi:multidrug efflux pump subunit AcrA (membrane-fusion protein)
VFVLAAGLCLAVLLNGCGATRGPSIVAAGSSSPAPADPREKSLLRATGVVQAVDSISVRVPQLAQTSAQGGRSTIVRLVKNGVEVGEGDVLVEFDRTALLDQKIEAKAKFDEIGHQLEEKKAQIRSDATKRDALAKEAQADLQKARLQLRKGPILAEIDRLKAEAKASSAEARVKSLEKSNAHRIQAEAAAVKILELKLQRQQVMLERIETNLDRLVVKAPRAGMVALENIWRNNSMGPPQEGDQVWPGSPLVRLFDPNRMVVETSISEADFQYLGNAATAKVYLDAYPGAEFEARLETSSLVATAGLDSPVRNFLARFVIAAHDRRLLPDLSASIEIDGARGPRRPGS